MLPCRACAFGSVGSIRKAEGCKCQIGKLTVSSKSRRSKIRSFKRSGSEFKPGGPRSRDKDLSWRINRWELPSFSLSIILINKHQLIKLHKSSQPSFSTAPIAHFFPQLCLELCKKPASKDSNRVNEMKLWLPELQIKNQKGIEVRAGSESKQDLKNSWEKNADLRRHTNYPLSIWVFVLDYTLVRACILEER